MVGFATVPWRVQGREGRAASSDRRPGSAARLHQSRLDLRRDLGGHPGAPHVLIVLEEVLRRFPRGRLIFVLPCEQAVQEGIGPGDVGDELEGLGCALGEARGHQIRLSRELPSLSAGDTRRLLKGATGLASGTASEGHGQTGAMLPALLRRVAVSGGTIRIELSNRALLDGTTGPGMIDTIEPGEPAAIEVPFQLRRRGVEIRLVLRILL